MSNEENIETTSFENIEDIGEYEAKMEAQNSDILSSCYIDAFEDLLEEVDLGKTYHINKNTATLSKLPKFNRNILRGVYAYGFEQPSVIQKQAIRAVTSGMDLIAQAQSGTGKTGAFSIGLLNNIDPNVNDVQGIILVNSLEMVNQIYNVISNLAQSTNIRVSCCKKDISVNDNIEQILGYKNSYDTKCERPHILVGTPGRTADMLSRTSRSNETGEEQTIINISTVKTLILDEADELLGTTNTRYGRGNKFIDQIRSIIVLLDKKTQVCLFSATMNEQFFKLTEAFMRYPLKIVLKREQITLEGIKQYYIELEEPYQKAMVIQDLYDLLNLNMVIIYCNEKKRVNKLYDELTKNNHVVSIIHSDLSLEEREKAMSEFRQCKSKVLISTDLIGRGIDVQQTSVIINYDLPFNRDNYIHRIGRSGRHGRKGTAINLLCGKKDMELKKDLEQYYETQIDILPNNVSDILSN